MGWAKIDHGFFRNPKVVGISKDAKFLYIGALCYCGEHLTDGVIPAAALRPIGAELDIKNPARAARELVACGLWNVRNDAEFEVNDYLDYNESSGERKAKQDAARERMKRNRSQNVRANIERTSPIVREQEEEEEKEVVKHPQTPTGGDGVFSTDDEPGTKAKRPQTKYPDDFEEFWRAYPSGNGNKARSYAQWKRIKPDAELATEIMAGLDRWKQCDRWHRGYIRAAEIWLRDAYWDNDPPSAPGIDVTAPDISPVTAAIAERDRLLRREWNGQREALLYGPKLDGQENLDRRLAKLNEIINGDGFAA